MNKWLCPLKDLQPGDLVCMQTDEPHPFNTTIVLHHDRKGKVVKFARAYARGSSYGTTCPTVMTGAEVYGLPYSEGNEMWWVLDKDTEYSDHRKTVYAIVDLARLRKAWAIMHEAVGKPVPEIPANEHEFRQKAWEFEYTTFLGVGVERKHLPLELLEMD